MGAVDCPLAFMIGSLNLNRDFVCALYNMPISVVFIFYRWLLYDEAYVYPTTTKIWQEENKDEISVEMFCHLILINSL